MSNCPYCRPDTRALKSYMCSECKRVHDLHEAAERCPVAEQESQAWIRANAARLRDPERTAVSEPETLLSSLLSALLGE